MRLTGRQAEDRRMIREQLHPDDSFDLVARDIIIGGRPASFYFVDGFMKDGVFEKVLQFLLGLTADQLQDIIDMDAFAQRFMPYVEADTEQDVDKMVTGILSGQTLILIDGMSDGLLVDARTYPMRGVGPPEKEKVLRGSRDGFVETLVMNTAMIRRRIRDTALRVQSMQVGRMSKVDVALVYIEGLANPAEVEKIRSRLSSIRVDSVSMTQEAICEAAVDYHWINPFPKVKFSERPDYTAACVMEGRIAVVMDNSPSVMILPASFADFMKEADDYYFPPLTSSYLKIARILISMLTVFLTPFFLYLLNNESLIPPAFEFIKIANPVVMPVFVQFLLLELVIDTLRLASTNTPSMMSNAMGIIGGLLLSEFAIQSGWFASEIILYMAFVAISSYAQPSFEMGYAFKFFRVFLLILTQIFGLWGFFGGVIVMIVSLICTKTITGKGYFYPIIPFNLRDFRKLFIRKKLKNEK